MKKIILLIFVFLSLCANTQNVEKTKERIAKLTSEDFFGRGYVKNGVNKAADYLAEEFKTIGVKPFYGNSYFQDYSFPITSFPKDAVVKIDGKKLALGKDFIIRAGSPAIKGNFKLYYIDSITQNDSLIFRKLLTENDLHNYFLVIDDSKFRKGELINCNNFIKKNGTKHKAVIELKSNELMGTVSTKTFASPKVEIKKDAFPEDAKTISINVKSQLYNNFPTKNLIAYIEGEIKDTFFVFSAHYDHIGGLGNSVFVPGAQDNASGTALVLDLADYYLKNKPKYSLAFMLFSGEEAGLLGSYFYSQNPLFDLKKIKFLINLDMVGTGDDGFTIVNGDTENIKKDSSILSRFKNAKDLIININDENKYFPEDKIKFRGQAPNSDHYPFFEKDVPCFFIYTMGGKTYYHNTKDRLETLTFTGYNQLFNILINFTKRYE